MLAICTRRSPSIVVGVVPYPSLSGSDLHGWVFKRALLAGFNLREANLRGADLSGADLSGADLTGADLTGADLTGTDLTGACYDAATRWPEGCNPQARGARLGPGPESRAPLGRAAVSRAESQAARLGALLHARETRRAAQSTHAWAHHLHYRAEELHQRVAHRAPSPASACPEAERRRRLLSALRAAPRAQPPGGSSD